MIRTLKRPRRASLFATDECTAMGTGIEQDPHLPIVSSDENDRATSHSTRTEISRLRNLRLVPRIDPTFCKDAFPLTSKYLLAKECLTINAKQTVLLIVND